LDITAVHESVHTLDFQFNMRLSDGHLAEAFDRISKDGTLSVYYNLINESEFLPSMLDGGHAADSRKELLPSLILSLDREDWEGAVTDRGSKFREAYLIALKGLRNNVSEIVASGDMSFRAPIVSLVNQRIRQLQLMSDEESRYSILNGS